MVDDHQGRFDGTDERSLECRAQSRHDVHVMQLHDVTAHQLAAMTPDASLSTSRASIDTRQVYVVEIEAPDGGVMERQR
ncbi:hypothetical protein GCM10022237_49170 [Nocardioides ginsengisoli]